MRYMLNDRVVSLKQIVRPIMQYAITVGMVERGVRGESL